MKRLILLSMAFISLAVSCNSKGPVDPQPVTRPSQYVTDAAKRSMLNGLEELDAERLYVMNYTVDYKLDEVLAANSKDFKSLNNLLNKLLFDVQPGEKSSLAPNSGCSAYAATLSGTSQYLMGRNYDFCHMEGDHEEAATAIVLFTAPEGGKKSVNFADAYWMEFHKGFYNNGTDISNLMLTPYIITDGMNEDGLAISVLHLDGEPADQNAQGKADIHASVAMRTVLDRFSTVNQAIDFLSSYNMHMETPAKGSLHFMLADAGGDYAIVEWSFADPMHVDSLSVPTMTVMLKDDDTYRYVTNFYVDPRLNSCIFGGGSMHGRDRYNTLRDTLGKYQFHLTEPQAKDLLKAVAQDPNPSKPTSHTQWSNLYNLSECKVKMAILQEYSKWYDFSVTGKEL